MNKKVGGKIACAVIGVGAFGKHFVRLLSDNPRASLVAVASPSAQSRGLDISESVTVHTDAQSIFQDTSIEAVIIATPVSTHAKLVTEAARSGKHILVEKPLSSTMDEAIGIENTLRDSKKVFMVGHQYLYNDHVSVLKKELDSGRIGNVRYVHAEQLYAGPIRHDIGCFIEAATHEIALLDYIFSPGLAVSVQASAIDLNGDMHEDFAAATIRYESGLFAHIVISSYSPIKSRRMIFGASNGMAIFDDNSPDNKVSFFLRPFPKGETGLLKKSLVIPNGEVFTPHIEGREPLAQEIEHFFDCIYNRSTPRTDIAHAMRVARVLAAVSPLLSPTQQ